MLALALAVLLGAAPVASEPVLDPVKVAELQKFTLSMRPELSASSANRLARIALHVGLRQDIDPRLLLAIARIESYLEPGTLACWPKRGGAPGEQTCDHGLMQINDVWVSTWKLDAEKLRLDTYLNVWIAAKLLAKLRAEFGALEADWYGRYHSNIQWRRDRWQKRLHQFYVPEESPGP